MILFNNPVTPLNFVFIVSNNNEQVSIQAFRVLDRRMNRERSWHGWGKPIYRKWSQIAFDPSPPPSSVKQAPWGSFFGPYFSFLMDAITLETGHKVCILPAMSICIKYTILRFVKGYCNSTTVACLFLTLPNWAKSANHPGKRSARDVKNVNRLELKMFRVLVCDFWIIGSTE